MRGKKLCDKKTRNDVINEKGKLLKTSSVSELVGIQLAMGKNVKIRKAIGEKRKAQANEWSGRYICQWLGSAQ